MSRKIRDRKAKADWLLQQSSQQFDEHQLQCIVDKCQQALAIYREIGDRKGEDRCLEKIVRAYAYLGGWS